MNTPVRWSCAIALLLNVSPGVAQTTRTGGPADLQVGALDARTFAAGYPRLFFSTQEVEQAKTRVQTEATCRDVLARLTAEADRALELAPATPDETWWEADKTRPWPDTYPQIHQHTLREPARYANAAGTLATAWILTGEQRYADHAEALLMALAPYRFVAEHYDVGMNYAIWGLQALKAYDALLPEISTAGRERLDGFFSRLGDAVARNDLYWVRHNIGGGLNNHLAWHKMMLGLLGLFYDREDLVDFCMNGPRGMVALLEDGLLDDGLWCESSLVYHFTAIVPMVIFADAQRRAGERPTLFDLTLANGRTLKQPFDAMFNVLAPDGTIPPIGDAYGARSRLWDAGIYEYAWTAWADPKYAWLLARARERTTQSLFSPPLPPDAPTPQVRSALLPEHGYAFLRSHHHAAYWDHEARCAFLTFDRSGVHSNADKLSLMLFGQGRMLLSDVEGRATVPHAFSSRIQRELNRGGLSQNTVMIDGQDQRGTDRLLRLVEFRDLPEEKRVTAADDAGLLYPGVRQMRTVCLTPDYVLDVFQVDAGEQDRQIDWIAHALSERAALPPEVNPLSGAFKQHELPQQGAWPWLKDARSAQPTGDIALDFSEPGARLRLRMINPGAGRVILCGYPATDEAGSGHIPMVIIRRHGRQACFAALWLIGDKPREAVIRPAPPRGDCLTFEVHADGRLRRHLVPSLVRLAK